MWTLPDLKPLQDDFSSIQFFPQSLQFFQCTAETKTTHSVTRVNNRILDKKGQLNLTCTALDVKLVSYLLCGAQLNLPHQVFWHLLFDLNFVFQRRLTKSPINEDLKRFPKAEVVFVETYSFLGLFLSLDFHGDW